MKKRVFPFGIFLLFTLIVDGYCDEFSDWKKAQDAEFARSQQQFSDWKKAQDAEFKAYLKAQDEAFKEYTKEIKQFWPVVQTTTEHKWVEYSDDYLSKKIVDFENKQIDLEVHAKDEKEARKKIEALFLELLKDDVKSAYKNDKLENKIAKRLNKTQSSVESNQKIIADILSTEDMKQIYKKIKTEELKVVKYQKGFVYKANIALPADTMVRKAFNYRSDVNKNSKRQEVPPELIYAIMHSESSFNPMARSHIPAYGLMQIVPKTAGVDSYRFLYGKNRVPSAQYLYNSQRNITMGSAYLHILYYKYLKDIKDPMSRLFCTISAYNTGAGNVAKAFIGNTDIYKAVKKINTMDSNGVYKHLMRNLPYNETRGYLKKVSDRTAGYYKLIAQKRL